MTIVRTRDEAISLVDSAVARFEEQTLGTLAQARAAARGACDEADNACRRCATKVSALEAALSAADERQARSIQSELIHARAALDQARRASRRIHDVSEAVAQLQRGYVQRTSGIVAAARSNLSGRASAIAEYHGGHGSVSSSEGARTSGRQVGTGLDDALASLGMTSVDVTATDLTDNPIQGNFERGGATRADYRWAVQTWNDTVGPGVGRGMSRPDFEARDSQAGAPPLRKTADVYDMFLGTDSIKVDRRPDGSLNVISGRHRLQIARELGIHSLPGEVY